MAKRFIDTNIFRKSFVRGLSAPQKLLWIYLFCDCSHAGIWEVDLEVAKIYTGSNISMKDIQKLSSKIVVFDEGHKIFIPEFIEFQYGQLKENNNAHNAVIRDLRKYNLIDENLKVYVNQTIEPLTSPSLGAMDMDKDMDMDKEKDKDGKKSKKTIPEFSEFKEYALEKCPDIDVQSLRLKYDAWVENNWYTSGKNSKPIANWKSTLLNTIPYIKKISVPQFSGRMV